MQTNGGEEYVNSMMKSFLDQKGIEHQISCLYTPQQNGIAERKHRHLVETALSLMIEASIPAMFWYHATFLINRMPCKWLDNKSPYQILFGENAAIHNLNVFGTAIYIHVSGLTIKISCKLDQVSLFFFGFAMGYKGGICYDIHSRKFIISWHVIHDKDVYPFKQFFGTNGVDLGVSQRSNQNRIAIW